MNSKKVNCAAEITLKVVGGKWKIVILYHIRNGVNRFGELKRSIAPITQSTLTKQLREMEKDGLLDREIFKEIPPRVEYSITELGESLFPVVDSMVSWGKEYWSETGGAKFC